MSTPLAMAALAVGGRVAGAPGSFPEHAVTVVVPFPAGGGTDIGARILAQKLAQMWGVPVKVENRSGVAGLVGAEFVSRAKPDGYVLLMGNVGTQSINPSLYADMPYDRDRAFVPISMVAQLPMVLVVNPAVPAKTIGEFVAFARAHPAALSYASSGSGGAPHIVAEMFKQSTGTFIVHIPYRGGAPAIAELLAGRVNLSFISVLEANARIRSGQLRALAVTSAERVQAIPSVPTLTESVAPGFNFRSWIGLLAPQGTPNEVVEKISADVRAALDAPETRDHMKEVGAVPWGCTSAQFGKFIGDERRRYAAWVREWQIHVE